MKRRDFITKSLSSTAAIALSSGGMVSQAGAAQDNMMSGGAIDPVEFGQSLQGVGFNLLVTDVMATVEFSTKILLAETLMAKASFAILKHGDFMWMLHADQTYRNNPMSELIKDVDGRGRGVELRLYNFDPDEAEARARENNYSILGQSANKPHGLRECYILDPDGYAWALSRHLRGGEG